MITRTQFDVSLPSCARAQVANLKDRASQVLIKGDEDYLIRHVHLNVREGAASASHYENHWDEKRYQLQYLDLPFSGGRLDRADSEIILRGRFYCTKH